MPVFPNKFLEFVQAKYGLSPDELHKLFESLGRVDAKIHVARRRRVPEKDYTKIIGKPMPLDEAVQYEKERSEARHKKNETIRVELLEDVDFDDLMGRQEVNNLVYPRRLAPTDFVRYMGSASDKLDALDRERARPPKIFSVREAAILDVMTLIKKREPVRVAQQIASRQRGYILNNPLEVLEAEYAEWLRIVKGEPTEEERLAMEEAKRVAEEAAAAEEERLAAEEAARNFGDLASVHTLLDDAAELIRTNPEAAAAIVRQWIGNPTAEEKKEQ